ncbi:lipopolysaccharide assembly protein LapA domain-containing protein [Streptomyces sp. H27-C3]|uniref:lipopolysaccharide assembly protein LapA domain-containing protein n=1 Tax=Streptomyces sp. H27-C3 TaxID=3046305 RepID=UPI0024B8D8F8|nr:lipopolysaccharide assembly protein LapA domain-containing protein [Streptomyces sp. H27-C3]MDJ0462795.1 lipopolysaccharide assembly protein LapA domain-containing protein [Streptomyces sp. H27-C3]
MSPRDASGSSGGRATTGRATTGRAFAPGRIAVAAIVVLTLVFIFENTRHVRIRLLIPEVTMPLYLALLAMAAIGALCGGYFVRRRR